VLRSHHPGHRAQHSLITRCRCRALCNVSEGVRTPGKRCVLTGRNTPRYSPLQPNVEVTSRRHAHYAGVTRPVGAFRADGEDVKCSGAVLCTDGVWGFTHQPGVTLLTPRGVPLSKPPSSAKHTRNRRVLVQEKFHRAGSAEWDLSCAVPVWRVTHDNPTIPCSANSAENTYTSLKVRTEITFVHVIGSFNFICVALGLSKAASFNLSEVYAFSALLTLRAITRQSHYTVRCKKNNPYF
jgi:hypothetical protein